MKNLLTALVLVTLTTAEAAPLKPIYCRSLAWMEDHNDNYIGVAELPPSSPQDYSFGSEVPELGLALEVFHDISDQRPWNIRPTITHRSRNVNIQVHEVDGRELINLSYGGHDENGPGYVDFGCVKAAINMFCSLDKAKVDAGMDSVFQGMAPSALPAACSKR